MSGAKKQNGFTILYAGNEQNELDFSPFAPYGVTAERSKLRTGDYTIKGYGLHFLVERKSLSDAVGTLTHDRQRFLREVYDRMMFAPFRGLVVEADWRDISRPYRFSAANPESITNSIFALSMPPSSIHVFCNRSRAMCAWWIVKSAQMFIHRATHGPQGVYKAFFAPDSADLAPIPAPYESI